MKLSEIFSIASFVIALAALAYTMISNTKKYELTYQYYNDILKWHNEVVEILVLLKTNSFSKEERGIYLSKLSALIETGRFYFPNIDKKDDFGKDKPLAYQGYRNVVLDFLVYEYQLFERNDCMKYKNHAELWQRLFTSYVFKYLEPKKLGKKIIHNTSLTKKEDYTIEEFLKKEPKYIYEIYNIDVNDNI